MQGPLLGCRWLSMNGPGPENGEGRRISGESVVPSAKRESLRKADCRQWFRDRSKTREKATPAGVRRRKTRQAAMQPVMLCGTVIFVAPSLELRGRFYTVDAQCGQRRSASIQNLSAGCGDRATIAGGFLRKPRQIFPTVTSCEMCPAPRHRRPCAPRCWAGVRRATRPAS